MHADVMDGLIIMNKIESMNAGKFNTNEFNELVELRKLFPDFRIVVRPEKTAKESYKGLGYDYMIKYIREHDDDKAGENLKKLNYLRGLDENGSRDPLIEVQDYGTIRMWFLENHPEIEDANKKVSEELKTIREKRAERRAA